MGWLFFPKLRSDYHLSPWKLPCWAPARRPTTRASRMIYIQNSYIFSRQEYYYIYYIYIYYCISHKVLHFEIYLRYPARKNSQPPVPHRYQHPGAQRSMFRSGAPTHRTGAVEEWSCRLRNFRIATTSLRKWSPEKPSSFTCKKPMGFPILPYSSHSSLTIFSTARQQHRRPVRLIHALQSELIPQWVQTNFASGPWGPRDPNSNMTPF